MSSVRSGFFGLVLCWLVLSPPLFADPELHWGPGTMIRSEYRELAGTIVLGAASPPILRAEGHEYLLILNVEESEIPLFANKTPAIMKGIASTVLLPGKPVQYLLWPMSTTIRTKTFEFPDPSGLHREWLSQLGRG